MDQNATIVAEDARNALELVRSLSGTADAEKGAYKLMGDEEDTLIGVYDKPLPCFGCGIGWFSFLSGFLCPVTWYYATFLYFGSQYRKDPRERDGLAASAIAALVFSVAVFLVILILLF